MKGLFAKLRRWIGALALGLVLFIMLLVAFVAAAMGGFRLLFQVKDWSKTGEWIEYSTKQVLVAFEMINYDEPVVRNLVGLNRMLEWFLDFHPSVFFGTIALILYGVITLWSIVNAAWNRDADASD